MVGPGGRGHRPAAGGPPDAGRRPAGRSGAGHLPARPGRRTAQRARAALGPAPAVEGIDRVLPGAGLGEQCGRAGEAVEPPASWLRAWAWSPVLPVPLLAGFAPLLAALRRARPEGPPDPRSAVRPRSRHQSPSCSPPSPCRSSARSTSPPPQPPRAVPRTSPPARPRPCSPPSRSAAPCPRPPTRRP